MVPIHHAQVRALAQEERRRHLLVAVQPLRQRPIGDRLTCTVAHDVQRQLGARCVDDPGRERKLVRARAQRPDVLPLVLIPPDGGQIHQ